MFDESILRFDPAAYERSQSTNEHNSNVTGDNVPRKRHAGFS